MSAVDKPKRPTPKQQVLAVYPDAKCLWVGCGYRVVYSGDWLASGFSAPHAWRNALLEVRRAR
jgi:hypothetical protein